MRQAQGIDHPINKRDFQKITNKTTFLLKSYIARNFPKPERAGEISNEGAAGPEWPEADRGR
jgi:hypothetical protein